MILMMLKDITQRKQAERLLRIQRDLSLAASAAPGPEEIIECLLDYSLRIEGLDSGGVYTIDESTGSMELVMSAGFSDDFVKTVSNHSPHSPQSALLASGHPAYLTFAEAALPLNDIREGEGLKAIAFVPIKHDNKVIGALSLASHTLIDIPMGAKHTIEAISGMIGGVFARAKAEKALRESEEKLRQSEKMQAIGQLAGGVAHDFNNQLMGITGYADLLQEAVKENPKLLRYVENVLIAARRAADLTAQLLAFARKGKYLSISVDIHKTIQEVIALLSHSIDKQIVIRRHLRADPCITTGDPTQLQSAVLNLALNARDAMPHGGELIFTTDVVAFLETRSWDNPPFDVSPGNYLSIGVSDTGEGMTEDVKRHIFEPFFTTKEQGKGTGMGLAAVFGTIKNHRGAVTVDSAPQKGTSFRILLPLEQPAEEEYQKPNYVSSPGFQGLRVLLVDDEDMVLKVAQEMLSYLGCITRICRNGREGVKMVQKHPDDFDLVILDMVMPEMNGRDALLHIKKITPSMKVLLSSGYSMGEKIDEHIADPSIQFIQKPFRLEELSQKIEEILSVSSKGAL
jgi:signal transduction histidine kinase